MERVPTLAVALALVAVLGGLAAAAGTVTVGVDAPDQVDTGESVDATVMARNVTDGDGLGAFEVNVSYDPALVSVDASAPAGSEFSVTTAKPEPGLIRIVGYVDSHPGPTGDVALADLSVTGESDGDATIGVSVESLADADGNSLANATRAASVTVGGTDGTTTVTTTSGPSNTRTRQPDDDPDTPAADPAASVTRSGGSLRLSVTGTAEGANVSVSLPDTGTAAETGVRFSGLNLSFGGAGEFAANVTPLASRPADTPAPDGPVAAYLSIDHDLPDGALRSAQFQFSVSQARLDDLGIAPDEVVLYRHSNGEWDSVSTEYLGQSGDGHRYRANSPGFSVFAVGQRSADASFAVTDVALSAERVEPGGTVEVTATVENTGGSDGTATLELFVDDESVATRTAAVPAGETRTVTFSHSPAETGSYEIRVNDRSGGTLAVGQAGTTADGTTAEPTTADGTTASDGTGTTAPGDGGIGLSGILGVLVVLAVLVGAGLYYRRQQE